MAGPPIYSGTQENTPGTTYTAGAFQGYTGKPGQIFIPANRFQGQAGSGFALNRRAKGDWVQDLGASSSGTIAADLGAILTQTLLPLSSPSGAVNYNPSNNGQAIGIAITKVNALYVVQGGTLTSGSVGVSKAVYTTAASQPQDPTVTDILAPTSLILAGAGGNMSNTTYTPTDTTYQSVVNTEILAEISAVTPASVVLLVFGLVISVLYNY